ncbi:phosphate acyltransferase [Ornithinimicrobium sp. CNJ-824]|uniref:phosphate acyltransferase n=1 Tax=Ornithinimicrobium sp. CNJ-824 TaxID=1904966 RepID=UPI00268F966F
MIYSEARSRHADVAAVIANRVPSEQGEAVRAGIVERLRSEVTPTGKRRANVGAGVPVFTVPGDPLLSAPTMRDLMGAVDGRLLLGEETLLDREVTGMVVAGMTMPHVLDRLHEGCALICPGDREEVLLATLLAHRASTFPSMSGILLNGGFLPSEQVHRLVEGVGVELPVVTCTTGTMTTATAISRVHARIGPGSTRKIERARTLVHEHVDMDVLLPVGGHHPVGSAGPRVITPLMFEHELTARARAADAHIVLPEGMEDRILRAADTLLARRVARLTLLGDEDEVRARAATLGLHLDEAAVVDPQTSDLRQASPRSTPACGPTRASPWSTPGTSWPTPPTSAR